MKFEENLEKALLLKTLKNKTLLLFISGNDSSKEEFLQDCLDNNLVGDQHENIIAVKLERDSKHYSSFLEIYPALDEPFVIFLGDKGIPMRIVKLCEHYDKEEVSRRVNEAILFCNSKTSQLAGDNTNKMADDIDQVVDENENLEKPDDIDKDIQLLRALIQFRMSDGAVTIHAFKYDATVAEMRSFVETVIKPDSQFQLALPHPFKILQKEGSTIFDLDLFPSAVVMVIPVHENSLICSAGRSIQNCVFMLPFSIILNFFMFLFESLQSWWQGVSSRVMEGPVHRHSSESRTVNLHGNVHTLRAGDGHDDSNNTYNGNSTQQN
ncbi:UBX domain-containing protein 4 [Nilaparvata lugens]|uniref:UBX domain-containing protein 4 n=1 Tax=Nilaparvata lugens TaxID=108931 RepID=UPI00193EC05A|nr:UBX domain-containing protein 4 [Nilaparvata lugens]